jgi:hypothetical protein
LVQKWVWHGKNSSLNNAFGVVSMIDGVYVISSSISGDRQITIVLRYNGKGVGDSPNLTIEVGALKFEFQELSTSMRILF